MAVYKFEAVREIEPLEKTDESEEVHEWGTVIASSESQARKKLESRKLTPLSVRRLSGMKAFITKFSADIK
ncbi:hypothetical protein ACFL1X_11805 [Candidatus Hydrogenedentota bacterium]